ncbi:hypothetical protein FGO68_gene5389 [Halteria grandinella]|uniref:Uncharacterized protein n=1 Tax=Halteria grandinella TaxID=5974 RepID=A0A8J8NI79_HALGN|nr:hypothetical protein FGO68_gene5389 [Halteria grandinella]
MESYEGLVKKLENQVITCQSALDESTKREIEQLQMVMELKLQIEKRKAARQLDGTATKGPKVKDDCETCEAYEMENQLLKEQTSKQQEVIDKLGEAQELLMLQYKVMEMGLNSEIGHIQDAQSELEKIKKEYDEDEQLEAEPKGEEKQDEAPIAKEQEQQ